MLCELTCTTTRISFVIEKWNELIVEYSALQYYLKQVLSPQIYVIETKLNFVSFNNKNLQRQRKLLANVTFPYKTLILIRFNGSMSKLQQGQEICDIISGKCNYQSCTQEWNAVQYLVNKTNNYGLIPE